MKYIKTIAVLWGRLGHNNQRFSCWVTDKSEMKVVKCIQLVSINTNCLSDQPLTLNLGQFCRTTRCKQRLASLFCAKLPWICFLYYTRIKSWKPKIKVIDFFFHFKPKWISCTEEKYHHKWLSAGVKATKWKTTFSYRIRTGKTQFDSRKMFNFFVFMFRMTYWVSCLPSLWAG